MQNETWPEGRKANREEETGDPLDKRRFPGEKFDEKDYEDGEADPLRKDPPVGTPCEHVPAQPDYYPGAKEPNFARKLASLLNSVSRENRSNTPDFILANFMETCLFGFENASNSRERWFGKYLSINGESRSPEEKIIDRLREYEAIKARRSLTDAEGHEYWDLSREWAKAVNDGRISTGAPALDLPEQPKHIFVMSHIDPEHVLYHFGTGATSHMNKAEMLDYIQRGYTIKDEKGRVLTPKEIGALYAENAGEAEGEPEFRFNDIDTTKPEGRLLMGAIAYITDDRATEVPKQIDDAMKLFGKYADRMDFKSDKAKTKFENAGNRNETQP